MLFRSGVCGFALVLALSQMREHGLGPFGRADLHPRRNPFDRQSRFAPQPGSAGQLLGVAPPASGQIGLLPVPARKLLRDDAVGRLKRKGQPELERLKGRLEQVYENRHGEVEV